MRGERTDVAASAMSDAAESIHYALARFAYAVALQAWLANRDNPDLAAALASEARALARRVRRSGCANGATLALADNADAEVLHITGPPSRRWRVVARRKVRSLMVELWNVEPPW